MRRNLKILFGLIVVAVGFALGAAILRNQQTAGWQQFETERVTLKHPPDWVAYRTEGGAIELFAPGEVPAGYPGDIGPYLPTIGISIERQLNVISSPVEFARTVQVNVDGRAGTQYEGVPVRIGLGPGDETSTYATSVNAPLGDGTYLVVIHYYGVDGRGSHLSVFDQVLRSIDIK